MGNLESNGHLHTVLNRMHFLLKWHCICFDVFCLFSQIKLLEMFKLRWFCSFKLCFYANLRHLVDNQSNNFGQILGHLHFRAHCSQLHELAFFSPFFQILKMGTSGVLCCIRVSFVFHGQFLKEHFCVKTSYDRKTLIDFFKSTLGDLYQLSLTSKKTFAR